MTLLEKLIYYHMHSPATDIYHGVVELILQNIRKACQATIYELADLCHVSTTTISRMCKYFGLENFQQFKSELSEVVDNYYFYLRYVNMRQEITANMSTEQALDLYLDHVINNINNLRKLDFTTLDQIVAAMAQAQKIYFFIYPFPSNALIYLQANLIMAGKKTFVLQDQSQQESTLADLDKETVAFFIYPLTRRANYLTSMVLRAAKTNATTILLANSNSPVVREVDLALVFEGKDSIIDEYSFQIVLDMISQPFRDNRSSHGK